MAVLLPIDRSPVFVLAAPRSGGRRLARWLTGPVGRLNPWLDTITRACAARGLDWRASSDAWTAEDALAWWPWLEPLLQARAHAAQVTFEYQSASLLRIGALATWFPQARFVLLYRDVRETLALMLDSWQAGRQVHPAGIQLPDGTRWNDALPPGWGAQCQRPLVEIVAWQWAKCLRIGLDALEALPGPRWCLVSHDRLLAAPEAEARRLLRFLGLPPAVHPPPAQRYLPAGRRSPDATVWRHHVAALQTVAPIVAQQADRIVRLFAEPPQTRVCARTGD